jgi:hypothetical protein
VAVVTEATVANKNKKRTFMVWVIFLALAALLVFGTRPLAKHQLEATLSEQLQRPVTVERLLLRPLQGQVQLHGVKLDETNYLQQGSVTLQIAPLWRKQLVIDLIEIDGLQLDIVSSGGAIQVAGLDIAAGPSEDGTSSQSLAWALSLQQLVIKNSQLNVNYEDAEHKVSVTQMGAGPVAVNEDFSPSVTARLTLNGSEVEFSGNAELLADMQSGSFTGNVRAETLELGRYGVMLGSEFANVAGELTLNQTFDGEFAPEQLTLQLQGLVTGSQLQLPEIGSVGNITYDGSLSASLTGLQTLSASLELQDVQYPALGSVNQIAIQALKYDPSRIQVDDLLITGVNMLIERNKSGGLVLPTLPGSETDTESDADTQSEESGSSSLPEIYVNTAKLLESRFEFIDHSMEPVVDLVLTETNLTLADFSLTDPFRFDLTARHHETELSTLGIKGAYAIAEQSGDIEFSLRDFEIHEIAPYLGNGVKSGRLRLTSTIDMQKGHIEVGNDVYIKNVKVDERAANSGDQMSLSTALYMLKNSDNEVEFEVPFETDFANFEIGLGDIIQTAMITAARSAAVAYAQYALQPYGSLLFAKNVLGAVTRPRFEPIEFTPADSDLAGDELAYVNKLGDFLSSRSELSVTVCGYAQMNELSALLERQAAAGNGAEADTESTSDVYLLKQLAEARSKHVREVLRAAGVKDSQLYGCTAAVETEQRKPRVELAL